MLNSTEHKLSTAHKNNKNKFLALNLSDAVFILLINIKMPTIVGILTFMSRINFGAWSQTLKVGFLAMVPK